MELINNLESWSNAPSLGYPIGELEMKIHFARDPAGKESCAFLWRGGKGGRTPVAPSGCKCETSRKKLREEFSLVVVRLSLFRPGRRHPLSAFFLLVGKGWRPAQAKAVVKGEGCSVPRSVQHSSISSHCFTGNTISSNRREVVSRALRIYPGPR